ncbi:MAG: hypothetical protein LBO66_15030 [Deltaproteobacteria bacterium]|jgi:hypothetical protein|nr:hypothetical protein [Deltaproteobacteria bacterium]
MFVILRIILIAALFYLIFWVIRGLLKPKPAPGQLQGDERELVRDALTGVYFNKNKAVTITTQGQTLYFLSADNRDAWLRRDANSRS